MADASVPKSLPIEVGEHDPLYLERPPGDLLEQRLGRPFDKFSKHPLSCTCEASVARHQSWGRGIPGMVGIVGMPIMPGGIMPGASAGFFTFVIIMFIIIIIIIIIIITIIIILHINIYIYIYVYDIT